MGYFSEFRQKQLELKEFASLMPKVAFFLSQLTRNRTIARF